MFGFLRGKKKEKVPELPKELKKRGKGKIEEFEDEEMPHIPMEFRDIEDEKKEVAPILPLPTDEESRMAPVPPPTISTGKGIKGPVFVSFRRYQEVKDNLRNLNDCATELKMIIGDLKINKNTGSDLLKELTSNLEQIEDKLNKINSTLRA